MQIYEVNFNLQNITEIFFKKNYYYQSAPIATTIKYKDENIQKK